MGLELVVFYENRIYLFQLKMQNSENPIGYQDELSQKEAEMSLLRQSLAQKEQEIASYQEQFKAQEAIFTQIYDLYNQLEEQKKIIETQNKSLQVLNGEILQKNEEIQQQTEEIIAQRDALSVTMEELELKSKHIFESINYAKRIQSALLPNINRISAYFDDLFILYKPRDVVSGDFYWFAHTKDRVFIAAADCTGHGVPGSLMSMIGLVSLNQIITEPNMEQPHLILDRLHRVITLLLKQKHNDVRDGMDISMCMYNSEKRIVEYAGAMNPIYYVQNGDFNEIKANKMPIGGDIKVRENYQFHTIPLGDSPSTFYLCSDGYQDQFGGYSNKKFMVKNLKKTLHTIHQMEMKAQHDFLDTTIQQWMLDGKESQTDDILIIGFKI
jgi:serine phosphatase RsbU (regulator of sigma subunit)